MKLTILGKGANQAVAAARLLGNALFCGQFGDDDAGNFVERGNDYKIMPI